MRRITSRLSALGLLFFIIPLAHAEENSAPQELRELRQAVVQQSRQIELLAEQVGRLTRLLQNQKAGDAAESTTSVESPKSEPVPDNPNAEAIPKAEAVSSGPKHVVTKGETLTSIAKQYNIPIVDLKNANKIENERKLQIGQILTVPSAKTPEPLDKKDNP